MGAVLKIGELSAETGCQVETIRYYERQGLLPAPQRSAGNYRLYGASHVERLRFIRYCRSLDITLDEIARLLTLRDAPDAACDAVNLLLDGHMAQVATRIAELKSLQTSLKELRAKCRVMRSVRECGILQGLSDTAEEEGANKARTRTKHLACAK